MKIQRIAGIIALSMIFLWGCSEGEGKSKEKNLIEVPPALQPGNQQVTNPPAAAPADGQPDQYGRMPSDEHYGHNHPPEDQQTGTQVNAGADNQGTGPDQYGRMPGHEHYGHNHPDEEQSGAQVNPGAATPAITTPATTAPANGEPDKFGRKPGEEHYGHDHQ